MEEIIEVIGQALFDYIERDDKGIPIKEEDRKGMEKVDNFLSMVRDGYTIVQWPDVQELMDEEWFEEEAVLDIEGNFGDSAYFIPIKRLL